MGKSVKDMNDIRRQIDAAHEEAVRAWEIVARYIGSNGQARATEEAAEEDACAEHDAFDVRPSSKRAAVLSAVGNSWKTIDAIVAASGLDKATVRGALYGRNVDRFVSKKKRGKLVVFKRKVAAGG